MNKNELDIMYTILTDGFTNQRSLAKTSGRSLGAVNRAIRVLTEAGWLDGECRPTERALREAERCRPKNAVILAAGFGMRMVPINTETSKGLLEVHGEPLVERLIRQLREVGVEDICIVVGYMKERYEYLIDEFGVTLVVNPEYAVKNNIHSLFRVRDMLGGTYIVPCDLWCARNLFRPYEFYPWYMVSDAETGGAGVRVNRKEEIVSVGEESSGNAMVGIAYITEDIADAVRERLELFCADRRGNGMFWEEVLYGRGRMTVPARVVPAADVVEINTYEQLRELDAGSSHLQSDALDAIASALGCDVREITGIEVLKKGMTNRSFLFSCRGEKYIMRIPGEGTDKLIDRAHEAAVYRAIAGRGLCDDVVYIDPGNGYKITRFLEGVRSCDPESVPDLERCMEKLRQFHAMRIRVEHTFDIFGQIEYYESLWGGAPSIFKDYAATKAGVLALRPFIEAHAGEPCLTHIDAVYNNFLFYNDGQKEALQLTDWEYAGMQDPHADVAMFCIYALYDRAKTDRLIDIYFQNRCPETMRTKIYAYMAACGLLWSNWCEYKRALGVEFGEYSLCQYRYAKEYARLAKKRMTEEEGRNNG